MDCDTDFEEKKFMDFSEPDNERELVELSNAFFPKIEASQDTAYGSCPSTFQGSWTSQRDILSEIQNQISQSQTEQSQHHSSQFYPAFSSQPNYCDESSELLVWQMDTLPLPSQVCSQLAITDDLIAPISSQTHPRNIQSQIINTLSASQRAVRSNGRNDKRYLKIDKLCVSLQDNIQTFAAYRVATAPLLYRVDVIAELSQLKRDLEMAINKTKETAGRVAKSRVKSKRKSCGTKMSDNLIRSVPQKSIIFDKMAGLVVDEVNKKYKKLTIAQVKIYVFLLEKLIQTVQSNTYTTSRDLYYKNMRKFQTATKLQNLLKDIYVTLKLSHLDCHIIARPDGFVYGDLTYVEDGVEVNCKMVRNGLTIPINSRYVSFKQSDARFILLVEKQATFNHIACSSIFKLFNFIMITGCGYPSLSTREFLQKLWLELRVPILALVDCDAYGFEIMCNYRFGSYQMAHANNLMIAPEISWFGVLPHEVEDLKLNGVKFSDSEKRRLNSIMKRTFIIDQKEWYKQLKIMKRLEMKVEIQELYNHSDSYLIDVYLPMKLSKGKWI